jgi:hypothetical protein
VNVKTEVFDKVRDKVGTLAEIFWKEVVMAAIELSRHKTIPAAFTEHERCKDVSKADSRAVVRAVDAYRCRFSVARAIWRCGGAACLVPQLPLQPGGEQAQLGRCTA